MGASLDADGLGETGIERYKGVEDAEPAGLDQFRKRWQRPPVDIEIHVSLFSGAEPDVPINANGDVER